jgi:PAS domain S-box-containing protein
MPDAPVLLYVFPVALVAVRFGLRGGVAAALLGVAIALVWYLRAEHFASSGWDLAAYSTAFLLVGALIGAIRDDRRMLERALAHHQELSLDLVCTVSLDGRLLWVNEAWTRTLGHTAAELCTRPLLEFVHPDDREAAVRELRRQAEEGTPLYNFQNRWVRTDGTYRWLEWTARRDPNADQVLAVGRDVTERKQAEEAIANYRARLEQAVRDRTAELERAQRETLRRLALAAEFRDNDTFAHTERVGETSALIAEQLGLPEATIRLIRLAAPLHDVGKLGVPDAILLKQGELTPLEFEMMKQHTLDGARMLSESTSDVLRLAEQIALNHHERWDGSGYPRGLRGEEIPLAARIVGVADVFDALTHARPYKPAWRIEDALAEIRRGSGTQFDPAVVGAFEDLDEDTIVVLTVATPRQSAAVHALASAQD